MAARYIGETIERLEDDRLLTGQGRFVDDMVLPGMLEAAFLRSSHAHAHIRSIDASAARGLPGVHAVLTADDLGPEFAEKRMGQPYPTPLLTQSITQFPLARDEVNFVGQTIAIAIADTRALAEDALALIDVDYEPLDAVVDCRTALDPATPKAHLGNESNLVGKMHAAWGDAAAAFASAPHTFAITFMQHRGGCHAMETRGMIAAADPFDGGLTLWSATQTPYLARRALAAYLGCGETQLRVVAPDVGGGFGPKAGLYPEEVVVSLAARILKRPVKWIEDRREHFYSTNTLRDQHWDLEIAAADDGTILAIRGHIIQENGAFAPYGMLLPFTTMNPFPGPYAIKNLDVAMDVVFTNTTPNTPIRGAGRPNTAFALDRAIEAVARGLKLDPVEVRRRNLIPKDAFPYATGHKLPNGRPIVYDSGDYHAALDKAVELAGYQGFRARQEAAWREGRYLGIGVSSCNEDTGMGPFEGVTVSVEPGGKVSLRTGAASQGQGHRTVFTQIVADVLGVSVEDVTYESADTAKFPIGVGTVASRVAVNAGTAAYSAACQVRDKAFRLAAELMQASPDELEAADGLVRVKSDPGRHVRLGELALKLAPMTGAPVPPGFEPNLSATSYDSASGLCFAYGTNLCEVEVDAETGFVDLKRYVVVHDCGNMLNPLLVEGQIVGGVVHGISNALYERLIYDPSGQPLTTNYGEYVMATATEMPRIDVDHIVTPSPLNPLGIKGAGEGGTIPALAAIVNAIEDALKPFGVVIDYYPVSPPYLLDLIDRAREEAAS